MKIIYTKFSNDRRAEYSIRTNILLGEDGKKYIEKLPVVKAGQAHVDDLAKWEKELAEKYGNTPYSPNRILLVEGRSCFEFVEGVSLESIMDGMLLQGKVEGLIEKLKEFADVVRAANDEADFEETEGFCKVFGKSSLPGGLRCGKVTNIDMIPANIIMKDGRGTIIDYEWTFDFPVPVNFVIYRILHYYTEGAKERHILRDYDLFSLMGIAKEEIGAYEEMEIHFQDYILGNMTPLWKMHEDLVRPAYHMDMFLASKSQGSSRFFGEVFYDFGEGIVPESCRTIEKALDGNGFATLKVEAPEGVRCIRIDPGDHPCILVLKDARGVMESGGTMDGSGRKRKKTYPLKYHTNGDVSGNGAFLFAGGDPQIYFDDIREETAFIEVTLSVLEDTRGALLKTFHEKACASYHAERNYDELEHHYLTAMDLKADLEMQVEELNRRAMAAEWKLHCIYKSIPYKLSKPYRMLRSGLKRLIAGTPKKQLRFDTFKLYLKGKGSEAKEFYEREKNARKTCHIQDKIDKLAEAEVLKAQAEEMKEAGLCFSILVPVYNTPENYLTEMIESVLAQSYPNYQLCIADGSDKAHKYVKRICKGYADFDSRICYKRLKSNEGIASNTNEALHMAKGDYIVLFDHDDLMHPEALYHVAKAIEETGAEYVYTDEAVFYNESMSRIIYHMKPDFSPDFLRGVNYICHLSAFSKKLMDKVGEFRPECDGSQDFDMTLRLTEKANMVYHLPKVLYFWRSHPGSVASGIEAKTYCLDSAKKALSDHLDRIGLAGSVEDSSFASSYHIKYEIKGNPMISILIPNKDHIGELETCLGSVFDKTTYENYEIVIIENGSEEEETFAYYRQLENDYGEKVRIVTWNYGFNYAAINNFGAKAAKGDYLLLLNNDTEVITPDWLQEMLMFAQREDVGVVGSMMYFGDDTIQHAGIIMGIGGTAGHSHKGLKRGGAGYLCKLAIAQDVSGVTGACMMIAKDKYEKLGGLDEKFAVAFNDVDFCCRLLDAGYKNVFTPFAELYHYESKSRGYEDTPEKLARFEKEKELLLKRHGERIEKGDPYYNPSLNLSREDYSLADGYTVFIKR